MCGAQLLQQIPQARIKRVEAGSQGGAVSLILVFVQQCRERLKIIVRRLARDDHAARCQHDGKGFII